MALRALHRSMGSGQRELGGRIVIELRALPLRGRVAHCAILGETRRHVVRIGRRVVIRQVAAIASGQRTGILAVDMALRALRVRVRPGQRELRLGVIELRARPLRGRVADRAVLREARRGVIGIGGRVVIGQVAALAGGQRAGILAVDMALRALHRGVGSGQRELGGRIVIELRALPLRRRMAYGAILGEARRHVVGIGGAAVIGQVAAFAGGQRTGILAADMALRALHRRVGPGQREPCLVVVELCALPLRGRVTDRAVLREARRRVVGIGGAAVIGQVAALAGGQRTFVHVVQVALGALHRGVGSGQRELGGSTMVKFRAFPLCRRVALRAILRKSGVGMIRVGGLVEGFEVAAVTALRRALEDPVDMALRALRIHVGAREREFCAARVVELRSVPLSGRMANGAVLGEAGSGVVRTGGLLEGDQMTAFAGLRRPRESAVDMAGRAVRLKVDASETEPAQVMVELRPRPLRRGVTLCAIPREIRRRVRRIGGFVECVQVAPFTRLWSSRKPSRHVTRVALDLGVRTGQRKLGQRRVIEHPAFPLCAAVANRTVAWESRLDVVGVLGRVEFLDVTVDTLRGGAGVLSACMAVAATEPRVCAGQREAGDGGMVELRPQPGIHTVTLVALQGDTRGSMRRIHRFVVVGHVAGRALRAEPRIDSGGGAGVTTLAGRHRVSADQREPVGVFPRLLDRHAPALYRVALLAIAAELPSMNIGVAGSALLAYILEDPIDVARRAGNPLMHAQQRPACLGIVVEFGLRPDGLPGCGGMATLAGNF